MKKNIVIFSILFLCALISGYLLSKASLTGRVGIDLFYKQYRFLSTPLKSIFLISVVYITIFLLLGFLFRQLNTNNSKRTTFFILFLGLTGAILTYFDFQHTLSHKLLGSKFHIGGYIFWLGWITIPVFYIVCSKRSVA